MTDEEFRTSKIQAIERLKATAKECADKGDFLGAYICGVQIQVIRGASNPSVPGETITIKKNT